MNADFAAEIVIGLYLGLLTSIFPALIAFALGFTFKYITGVTVPGLGVVVLGGGLAGISGGLLGLLDPTVAGTPAGVTALLVVLMVCLWAHSIGDTLGASIPRRLTLGRLRDHGLSPDLSERVDVFGQIRVRPIGEIQDIEGYQPLPADVRDRLRSSTWKVPASRPREELESLLVDRIMSEFDLAEVSVSLDRKGHVEIAAAPAMAGLSRRVPADHRAVTIRTVLPTGLSRGDVVTLTFEDGAESVEGEVVSARTDGAEAPPAEAETTESGPSDAGSIAGDSAPGADGDEATEPAPTPRLASTTGGDGAVTVAVPTARSRQLLQQDFAKLTVQARGRQREYEVIGLLQRHGNRFERVPIGPESPLDGVTIGEAGVREAYGVAILSIRRARDRIVGPDADVSLQAGDDVTVVGRPDALTRFREAVG